MSHQSTLPCRVIAEIAQAHDGSLGTAHSLIDCAADAGAWAVKFQAHFAAAESTTEEPWRIPFSLQDSTRYDYWKRMEFSGEQWAGLKKHAADRKLEFIVSPFSNEAVDLLSPIGVSAWKIASGETSHFRLIERILQEPAPVLISTGMSSWTDIENIVELMHRKQKDFVLFQCDTQYPSPAATWGLNVLQEMKTRFGCATGLSDHSGDIYAGLAAASLGASLIEVHLTLSNRAFGPDVTSSLAPDQLSALIKGVTQISNALQTPSDKDLRAEALKEVRAKFSRSVALKNFKAAGSVLTKEDLTLKKPAGGFPESQLPGLVGRTLAVDLPPDLLLREQHLKPL